MSDLISVIIPVYKVEIYLKDCIESVLCQTYQNLEIFLVDDGSPDRCGEMCDAYAEKDNRIQVIHKENGGLSDARNAALDAATGKWVFFLDSDDTIKPETLSFLIHKAQETHSEITIIESDYGTLARTGEICTFSPVDAFYYVFGRKAAWCAWGKLFLRTLFNDLRFPKGMLYEDLALIPQIFLRATTITYCDIALYHYTVRTDSIMGQTQEKVGLEIIPLTVQNIELAKTLFPPRSPQYQQIFYTFFAQLYSKRKKIKDFSNNMTFMKEYKKTTTTYLFAILRNRVFLLRVKIQAILLAYTPRFYLFLFSKAFHS